MLTGIKKRLELPHKKKHPDDRMNPRTWWNQSTSIHYFKSYLSQATPWRERDGWKVIEVKPGRVQYLPHGFYTVHTRDGGVVKGAWVEGEAVEAV